MTTYKAVIDGGEGGATEIQARNIREALSKAADWAAAGEWREDGEVRVLVRGGNESEVCYVAVKKSPLFSS